MTSHDEVVRGALVQLFDDLNASIQRFEAQGGAGTIEGDKIRGMRAALDLMLEGISNFLFAVVDPECEQPVPSPLLFLRDALQGLEIGRASPIFEPVKRAGGQKATTGEEVIKGHAAALMSTYISGRIPKKDAAKKVAKILAEEGYTLTFAGREITENTVSAWRDEVAGVVEKSLRKEVFDGGLSLNPSQEVFRASLSQVVRSLRPPSKSS